MDIVQQLKNAVRCPCCLKKPEPNTSCVGMCENGHMTCEVCANQLIRNRSSLCPVCRQPNFKIIRGHFLAVSVIEILTAFLIYSCKHPNCKQTKQGNEIAQHEAQCSLKPIQCPVSTCRLLDQLMNS